MKGNLLVNFGEIARRVYDLPAAALQALRNVASNLSTVDLNLVTDRFDVLSVQLSKPFRAVIVVAVQASVHVGNLGLLNDHTQEENLRIAIVYNTWPNEQPNAEEGTL